MTDILPLIPQRPPFVMADTLVNAGDAGATTRFEVRAENMFVVNDRLTEPALIENIAQTAAARMGYLCRQRNEEVPVGFIGAVQSLEIFKLPATGDLLTTTIVIKNQVFDVTVITGKITVNGEDIAQCEMKIFIQSVKQ